jgi:iron complex outermembrane receptor protein
MSKSPALITLLLASACIAPAANADEAHPDPAQGAQERKAESNEQVQRITITGGRNNDMQERRNSTASKMVFGREELDRNGDSTVGEILKRLPGVTISGRPGRGGDIRMRGLGSGYTQILLNGTRPPRGFSLDSLSPDQIERIEVYRAPVAEFSTQAIAGTINIVLREDFQQKQTQIRLADSIELGQHEPSLSFTHPGKAGDISYQLSGTVYTSRQRSEVFTDNVDTDASGKPVMQQHIADDSERTSHGIHLAPRASWRISGADTLVLQPFLMQARSTTHGDSVLAQPLGTEPPQPYTTANWNTRSDFSVARMMSDWQHRFKDNSKLNVKLSFGASHNDSDTLRSQNAPDNTQHNIVDTSNVSNRSAEANVKYSTTVAENHVVALGWNGEWNRREETRTSLDNGRPQFFDSGDNLSARVRRMAVFGQDEWDLTSQWSMYAGLRWEGISTSSTTANGPVDNSSSVWSPILQAVWRVPGKEKDQVRFGLTHSYRAPGLSDLVALPVISQRNSATSPDRIGNPGLKPELSTGIDAAYEHYLPNGGILSASVFARDIKDLIRRNTSLETTPDGLRWISRPSNIGHAFTSGIELEAKFGLRDWMVNAPSVDVRANYSRFWSKVDDIPGPDNRLDQQPKQTANLGLDYRLKAMPLTLGGNLNWTPAYVVQSSAPQLTNAGTLAGVTQIASVGLKRQLDLYGLWKFNPNAQLRLSANNLINSNYLTGGNVIDDRGINHGSNVLARTYTTWTLRLELKI